MLNKKSSFVIMLIELFAQILREILIVLQLFVDLIEFLPNCFLQVVIIALVRVCFSCSSAVVDTRLLYVQKVERLNPI
jgi:hypothetical protein